MAIADGTTTTQNQAIGRLSIRGVQATATWRYGANSVYGNYTYTHPRNVEPTDSEGNLLTDAQGNPLEIRIGDIASHQLNLGVNARFLDRLNLNVRLNHVGARQTGRHTTVDANPLDEIDAYTVLNGTFGVENVLPGVSVQLIVNNILDNAYFHPGARSAGPA